MHGYVLSKFWYHIFYICQYLTSITNSKNNNQSRNLYFAYLILQNVCVCVWGGGVKLKDFEIALELAYSTTQLQYNLI